MRLWNSSYRTEQKIINNKIHFFFAEKKNKAIKCRSPFTDEIVDYVACACMALGHSCAQSKSRIQNVKYIHTHMSTYNRRADGAFRATQQIVVLLAILYILLRRVIGIDRRDAQQTSTHTFIHTQAHVLSGRLLSRLKTSKTLA